MPGKRDSRQIAPLVVGICGSPRKGGNTDILLDEALKGAKSRGAVVEKFCLGDLTYSPCLACGGCDTTGVCVIRDGMQAIYESIRKADAVFVASPIFFGTVTAQLKAMIDRFQCRWIAKFILKKKGFRAKKARGYFLSACGSPDNKYFTNARKVVRFFFATTDIDYSGQLFCRGVERPGDVVQDRKAMMRAFLMGESAVISRNARRLKDGKKGI